MDLAIEQGVVDRMKDAVADAGDDREERQHRVARARREAECRRGEERDAAEQDRTRAETVDDEARHRLHRARDDEEDGEQDAELGVAGVEGVLQPREERRQQELAKVADQMSQADKAHHGRVLACGGRWQGRG